MASILEHDHLIYKLKHGFDFPIFHEYYERAVGSVWRHQEVAMESDLRDWGNATQEERDIIAGVLKGFVTSELGIGCYWSDDVCAIFPKPEIQAMARAFAFFETIHAAAYAYLNDVLGLMEYEAFASDPVALQKVEKFFEKLDPKISLGVYSGAGEGVSLYSSFAILLSFNLTGRFKGLAQIISWSCVDGETEILTPNGWKRIDQYQQGEKIAQFDPKTKAIKFVLPSRYIQNTSQKMYKISKKQRFDQFVTSDHRIVDYKEGTNEIRWNTADKWGPRQSYLPVAGYLHNAPEMTPLDRFVIALQADGHIRKGKSLREVNFGFSRQRKIDRFRELAKDLVKFGFDIKESRKGKKTLFRVLVHDDYLKYRTKTFSDVYTMDTIPKGFIEELVHWDGHQREGSKNVYYSSKVKENVEFVQAAGALFGYYGHIQIQDDHRWQKPCRQYRLNLKPQDTVYARGCDKDLVEFNEDLNVYCFTVDTGAFLTKRNGLISVTGNCRDEDAHADAGSLLFKELVKEQPLTDEEREQIYTGFNNVLENEFAFIESVFDNRSLEKINLDDMKAFLRVRANNRLQSLGLEPLELDLETMKRARNISEWFYPMVQGSSSNDFFAQLKDGANYSAKIDQDFRGVDLKNLNLDLFNIKSPQTITT